MSDRTIHIGTSVLLTVVLGGGLGWLAYAQHKQTEGRIADLSAQNAKFSMELSGARGDLAEARKEFGEKTEAMRKVNEEMAGKLETVQDDLADQLVEAQKEAAKRIAEAQAASDKKAAELVAALAEKHEKLQGDLMKAQADTSAKVASGVDLVEKYVGGQNTILDRALGKYVPVLLPKDLEGRIAKLESQSKDAAQWPQTEEAVAAFAEELRGCINAVPAWAERDLLPRTNVLRWDASAFKVLMKAGGKDKAQVAEDCGAVLDVAFDGVQDDLVNRLRETQDQAEKTMRDERRVAVLAAADKALGGEGDATKAWEDLAYLVDQKDVEAIDRQSKLRSKVLNDKAMAQVEAMKKSLGVARQANDDQLRQMGYRQIAVTAASQRLAWLEEGVESGVISKMEVVQKDAERQAEALAKDDADRKWLAYQKWALGRIQEMRKCMADVKFAQDNKTAGFSDTNENRVKARMLRTSLEQMGTPTVGAGMKKYLIEVDSGRLDPGVSAMYGKTWQDAWGITEGEKTQEEVAKAAAVVPKKGLNDVQ